VIHLVDRPTGICEAVVKVPLTDEARIAVLHEAEVLDTLASERYEHSPRLLHVDWERAITTQTFVEGNHGSRKLTPDCWQLLRSLVLAGKTTTLAEHADTWARELRHTQNGWTESMTVAGEIEELRDDSPLPACWQHGDFTPWNIKRLNHGGCALLDWEDGQCRSLPLQDAFHFLHMQDWLFGERPKLHAAELWKEAVEMEVPFASINNLEAGYLVSSYLKCVREHNHERARFVSVTLALRLRKAA
jgi:hypothetical protein